ncbi:MAG: hypothetical protein IT438_16325 [Phycisphaerales bacterium]|nr:hypothetical protein [Phycisphaerales bacterium]
MRSATSLPFRAYSVSITALAVMVVFTDAVNTVRAQVPYFNNFNAGTPGPEWSNTTTTTATLGERFLGRFGAGTVSLNLGVLPAGNYTLEFDFYALVTLDGNGQSGFGVPDNFRFSANTTTLFYTNFANWLGANTQAYPNQLAPFGPGGSFAPGTGAVATSTLYPPLTGNPNITFVDSTYHFALPFAHAGGNLTLNFLSGQNQSIDDEGWGLDNVSVVPAPSAAAILGLGGLFASRRRR